MSRPWHFRLAQWFWGHVAWPLYDLYVRLRYYR
jgi:hypothetical protein